MHTRSMALALVLVASAALAADKEVTVNVEKAPAIKLSVPEDATSETRGDKTSIQIKRLRFHVWPVSTAKTVEDALPSVAEVIKSEFKNFVADSTDDTTIAGAPAKRLTGKGVEADDEDDGIAEIVVFSVGQRVFVACADWEGKGRPEEKKTFLEVLKSAKAP